MEFDASIEWVCEQHPDRVEKAFEALDLNRKELSRVKTAVDDRIAACEALIDYFRDKAKAEGLAREPVEAGEDTVAAAQAILRDTFTFQGVTGTPPRKPDGSLDWAHRGPNDDREWAFFLNRNGHLSTLYSAYRRTGNRAYADRIDADIREWVQVNPYPGQQTGEPQWRGLETMARISAWTRLFYALADDPALQPGTRILILSSLPDHAHYTQHFHSKGGNWLAMQMTALATGALRMPEYKQADEWLDYAIKTLLPEMDIQVYPDGPQKELASHYHGASLLSFQRFADLLTQAGRDVPQMWQEGLERMWNYWAYSMRPDGHGVLNNDSNLDFNRPRVLNMADPFNRPDWAYIATNGEQGKKPEGLPSVMFPWAGQLVMRSGWDADAHWGFFDVGPWGTGHQHNDKLHLSVAAFGRDILVDAGRLYYKGDTWRRFIRSTAAHNTLLIDGQGQNDDVREVTEPLSADEYAIADAFDYARGAFTAGYQNTEGKAVHTRAVTYVRGQYWVVVDRVETDRPRKIEALWHFHPDCAVAIDGQTVHSTDKDKGNARVHPVGNSSWNVELIRGQEEPFIQGWYSRVYNHKTPATCAVYTTHIERDATFAWVIFPAKGSVPTAKVELVEAGPDRATVRVNGQTIAIPLKTGHPTVGGK